MTHHPKTNRNRDWWGPRATSAESTFDQEKATVERLATSTYGCLAHSRNWSHMVLWMDEVDLLVRSILLKVETEIPKRVTKETLAWVRIAWIGVGTKSKINKRKQAF